MDLKGAALFKHMQIHGAEGFTPEQISAAKGYQSRYENAPFFVISNLWILLCAFLVFIMHLGFACLESGLTQKKNSVNLLFKNVFIICAVILLHAVWGFNAMYPGDWSISNIFAFGSPIAGTPGDNAHFSYGGTGLCQTGWTDFIFQAIFAATAATIVSGAVAERVNLSSFMIFAALLVGFAYPITGRWKWGGGFLDQLGFYDFAGSSLVHAFAWNCGPRLRARSRTTPREVNQEGDQAHPRRKHAARRDRSHPPLVRVVRFQWGISPLS